ncbi:hypothetical protein BABINDRAFT_91033 [Babjeviella inositovora NRRL Y-12698]|uniref:Zn(2)-C6 fungal-type domain-containing protein n=1 Tax=Babjeviella inositovora NRRL Y-12698 TaxID=984486 RepID=A0A1E3QJW2_9ASCO|nr:uncharacterized protein BABINDRAFT_91033 [Babjeviella inositovora NRRL Y-12698]ODQ77973.1 hypothetical protein BABINDRAFT_91033 [Babjeviella inositovora NRRL Y-12698]
MSTTSSHEERQSQLKLIRTKSGAVRISQACDRCRIKKIKCDGSLPCNNCAKGGFNCSISDKLTRRSFPKGYTENLERNIKALETENNDLLLKLEDMKQQLKQAGAPEHREANLTDAIKALSNTNPNPSVPDADTPASAASAAQAPGPVHTYNNYIINEHELKVVNCEKFKSLSNKFNELLFALNLKHLAAPVDPSVSTYSRSLDYAMENFKLDDYLFKILSQVPKYAQTMDPMDINHRSNTHIAKTSEIFDNKLKLDHVLLNYFHHYNSLIPILTFKNFLPHYLKFINKLMGVKQKALLVLQSQADPTHIRYALRSELIQLIKDYKLVIIQILMITKITLSLNPLHLEDDFVDPLILCSSFNNVCKMSLNSISVQLLLVHYLIINNDQTNSFKILHLLDLFITLNSYTSIYNVQGLSTLAAHLGNGIVTAAGPAAQLQQNVWDNKIRLKIIWSLKILTQIYRLKFGHSVTTISGTPRDAIPKLNSFVKDSKLIPTNLFQDLIFAIRESPFTIESLIELDALNHGLESWRNGIKQHQANYYHEFSSGSDIEVRVFGSNNLSQTTNLEKSLINYQLSVFYFTLRAESYLPFFINTLQSSGEAIGRKSSEKLKYEHFVTLAFISEQFLTYTLFVFDKKNDADYSAPQAYASDGEYAALSTNMIILNLCALIDFPKHIVVNCFYLIYCCLLIFKPNPQHHARLARCLAILHAVCALFTDNTRVADLVRSASQASTAGYDANKIHETIKCIRSETRVLGEGVAVQDVASELFRDPPAHDTKRFKFAKPASNSDADFYSDTASLVSSAANAPAAAPFEWGTQMSRQNLNASTSADPGFDDFRVLPDADARANTNAAFARDSQSYTGHAYASLARARLRRKEELVKRSGPKQGFEDAPLDQPSYEILFNWSSNLENLKDDYMFTNQAQPPEFGEFAETSNPYPQDVNSFVETSSSYAGSNGAYAQEPTATNQWNGS